MASASCRCSGRKYPALTSFAIISSEWEFKRGKSVGRRGKGGKSYANTDFYEAEIGICTLRVESGLQCPRADSAVALDSFSEPGG
jgi:hypothetical protein